MSEMSGLDIYIYILLIHLYVSGRLCILMIVWPVLL
jgi:hypothetical protein